MLKLVLISRARIKNSSKNTPKILSRLLAFNCVLAVIFLGGPY